MPQSPTTYDAQRIQVQECLKSIERTMIECLCVALTNLYDHTRAAGIAPELVTTAIHEYAAALPDTLAPIKIEVLLDTLPPVERRH